MLYRYENIRILLHCAIIVIPIFTSGSNIKTVQENLGHHTAAFTLSQYAHSTEKMKTESAARMDQFIKGVSGA